MSESSSPPPFCGIPEAAAEELVEVELWLPPLGEPPAAVEVEAGVEVELAVEPEPAVELELLLPPQPATTSASTPTASNIDRAVRSCLI